MSIREPSGPESLRNTRTSSQESASDVQLEAAGGGRGYPHLSAIFVEAPFAPFALVMLAGGEGESPVAVRVPVAPLTLIAKGLHASLTPRLIAGVTGSDIVPVLLPPF